MAADRHYKNPVSESTESDDEAAQDQVSQRTPPAQLPPAAAAAAVAAAANHYDRHDKNHDLAVHGIFWTDKAPPVQPNQAAGGTAPIVTDPASIIGSGNLKDLATLEDRHGLNLDGILLNAYNGGQTQFTPEPTDMPTMEPTISMSPTPANETDSPTFAPTITMMPTTDAPTLTFSPTTTMSPTTTKSPTISPAPTITQSPTTTMSPTMSPKPTFTQEPTFTQSPTFTMTPTEQGPTPEPTPAPSGTPTTSPTSVCFSTRKNQGNFGDIEAEGSLITVPYRYEVELLPDGSPPVLIQEVERPEGWGWGSSGGTDGGTAGTTSSFRSATIGVGGGGRRRMAVPQDLLSNLIHVETLGSKDDRDANKSRRLQDDASQPTPEAIAAVATLTNEILPELEIRVSDSMLPVVFAEECGQIVRRKRARQLQQQVDVLGLTAAPPDSPNLEDECKVIIPEGDNTCTVVDGALRLRVAGNFTALPAPLQQDILDTIRDGMGPTGTYRLADGRIVRLAYAPGNFPAAEGPAIIRGENSSTIPAYPFIIVALFIAAMIGALVFYRKRHLTREMQMYDEDGNPLGADSAYDESGYAPPGDMIEGGDGYEDGTFDEYGDSFAGSQQPGGNQYLEDENYGDGGDGYGDEGGYGDDGYNDGGGGGFDTIEEGNEDDWGNEYGVNENESQMQQSQDEYSNQW